MPGGPTGTTLERPDEGVRTLHTRWGLRCYTVEEIAPWVHTARHFARQGGGQLAVSRETFCMDADPSECLVFAQHGRCVRKDDELLLLGSGVWSVQEESN